MVLIYQFIKHMQLHCIYNIVHRAFILITIGNIHLIIVIHITVSINSIIIYMKM